LNNFLLEVCRILLLNAFQYSKYFWIFNHIMMWNRDVVVFLFDTKLFEQAILHQSNLDDVFLADFTILHTSEGVHRLKFQSLFVLENLKSFFAWHYSLRRFSSLPLLKVLVGDFLLQLRKLDLIFRQRSHSPAFLKTFLRNVEMFEDFFGNLIANLTFDFVHLEDYVTILLQFVIIKCFATFIF
jgi:hypothetical protein